MRTQDKLKAIGKLLLFGIVLFLIYWKAANYIQTQKLYPWNQEWLTFSVWQKHAPSDCFRIEPNHLQFYGKDKLLHVNTGFMRACNFTKAYLWYTVSDLDTFQVYNPSNITMKRYGNLSEKTRIGYVINASDMREYKTYYVDFYFKLNSDFYNFYNLVADGSTIGKVNFVFDNSLQGYKCDDQECFTVIEGSVKKEEPIWRGFAKEYQFDNSGRFLIRYSPKSSKYDFFSKLLDTFILGSVTIVIYEITNIFIFKNKEYQAQTPIRKNYYCKLCNKNHRVNSTIGREHSQRKNDTTPNKYVRDLTVGVTAGLIAGMLLVLNGSPLNSITTYLKILVVVVLVIIVAFFAYPTYKKFEERLR